MKKIIWFFLLVVSINAQTSLSAGHIAFIGWFSDGVDGNGFNDGFTFILLRDLSAGTVIYFTDNGWTGSGWVGSTSEIHVSWTVPTGGLALGTIVYIYESPAYNNGIASVGTLSNLLAGDTWHWASGGDQILAYQGSSAKPSNPTFIAALDADYASVIDQADGWSFGAVGSGYEETFCALPTGLTNGTTCVALFNSVQGELWDNCKYNGTLTGTATDIRNAINTYTNWTGSNSTPYDISSSAFPTPNITNPLPVELTSFTVALTNGTVLLNWTTATEVNNFGFEVERSKQPVAGGTIAHWEKIGFVAGNGNSNSPKDYSFADRTAASGIHLYRLKQIDSDGKFSYSKETKVEISNIPTDHALYQNYPNPFNPITIIKFALPVESKVNLEVYNIVGEKVATLIQNENKDAGFHQVNFNCAAFPSGVYFYKLTSGNFTSTKKLILMK